jgi:hypothetical protein
VGPEPLIGQYVAVKRAPRRYRLIPIACVLALVTGVVLLAEGESVDARGISGLLVVAWWVSPLALYYAQCVTPVGAALLGIGYLVAVAGLLSSIYRSDSSTAAIGFVAAPMLLWVGVAAGLVAENLVLRFRADEPTSRVEHTHT